MYGYAEFTPLTEEEILKRVEQEDIAEMILGYKPVLYQFIKSPIKLRWKKDNTPGARFEMWNGRLFFIDFGDQPTHRVIFKFVADYYGVKFFEALKIINEYFELGLGEHSKVIIPKPVIEHQIYNSPEKQRTDIIYKPRPFGKIDKEYWMPYEISRNNLIEDEVVAAVWYKFYSNKVNRWVVQRPTDPTYIFTEFKERVKVYRPLHNHKHRFITNCTENDIGGYNQLPISGHNLIIKKSYKDHRVIKNQGLANVIWFQNEGCVPSESIIINLCKRFDNIYIFFDNDQAGIEAAFKLTAIFNSHYPEKTLPIWLPEDLLSIGIKDPAELQKKKGRKELNQFLIYKGLYEDTINNT
jgi:hypothetical protein